MSSPTKSALFAAVRGSLVLALLLVEGCRDEPRLRYGGYLEAEKIEVGSRVGGRVKEVLVEEGDEVAAGQVLVRFETVHLEAELAEAQHRLERLETTLEKLKAGPRPQEIEKVRQTLAAAAERRHNAAEHYKRGLETGQPFVTREELADRETAMKVAQSDELALTEELKLLEEGTRAEDIVIARHELDEAQAVVARLQNQLDEGTVKAPVAAVVEVFDLQPGDLVPGGAPLATLVRKEELWVRCFVPTTQITFLRPGQQVDVTVDSRPNEVFTGTVLRINRVAEYTPRNVQTFDQREDQVFGVKVRVKDPQNVLRPGMAAVVRIRAGKSDTPKK